MSRVYVVVYIYNGIVDESKAFEDEDKSHEFAYELAKKYQKGWFKDAYLKDWMDVVEYQSQLDHLDSEILIAYTELVKIDKVGFCDGIIQWFSELLRKGF